MNEKTYYIKDLKMLEDILQGKEVSNNIDLNAPLIYVKKEKKEESYILLIEKKASFNKVPELAVTRLLSRIKQLEIINNNFIPVFSYESQDILFNSEEYLSYHERINGIKEYSSSDYNFSNNLYFQELDPFLTEIDANFKSINDTKSNIVSYLQSILNELNINLTDSLVDIGSTGRGTNIPTTLTNSKNDFDFLLFLDENNLSKVRNLLLARLVTDNQNIIRVDDYRLRLKNVTVPGLDEQQDIDISFSTTKEKYYSKEHIINSVLLKMHNQDDEKYRLVLANIMFAKSLLKSKGAYKQAKGIHGDRSYGGLGGVGIENWIIQNGGSFIDASRSFVNAAEERDFMEFQKHYEVLDFGKDHVCVAKGLYPYSNYVIENMRSNGYIIMKETLKEFLDKMDIQKGPKL